MPGTAPSRSAARSTLRYEGDDEDDTQDFFVGSIEERQGDLPVVSPSSPLGQALLGRSAGDTVEYAGTRRRPQGPHRGDVTR